MICAWSTRRYTRTSVMTTSRFAAFIDALIRTCGLEPRYVAILTDASSLALYQKAFTHVSFDAVNNYEVYEQLGDITVNKFLVWYFHYRFSVSGTGIFNSTLGVKIIARLRIKYGSKQQLSELAERLGFWEHIRVGEVLSQGKRLAALEDVFESFIGVTEYLIDQRLYRGLGYIVCYTMLSHWFDTIPIDVSYEQLFDAKTRLKELFDVHKDVLGVMTYGYEKHPVTGHAHVHITRTIPGEAPVFLGEGSSEVSKAVAEQAASEAALATLAKQGYVRDIPSEYKSVLSSVLAQSL
jgi:dsRNA-specific ribonuclease